MNDLKVIQYADDLALVAHLSNLQSLNTYINHVKELTKGSDDRHLLFNVTKTKELCLDGYKNNLSNPLFKAITVNSEEVERVSSLKYLGTVLDQSFTFTDHEDYIYEKAQLRLFLLCKLRSSEVSQYQSLNESLLSFNTVSWFKYLLKIKPSFPK